jgi:uncharacterized protein YqjF (DUF2071 family)
MNRDRPFMEAEWRHLALLNYEVDPLLLEPFVPAGTTLDTWEDKSFVSVVGFMFLNSRIKGLPIPFHSSFEEVNLRFYVKREVEGEVRRAVTFIQEFVPKPAVSIVARLFYNENYAAVPMGHCIEGLDDPASTARSLSYSWGHPPTQSTIEIAWDEPLGEMPPGSEEEFIAEHYWGYSVQRDGGTIEYEVEHPRWMVARAREARLTCDVAEVYGDRFVEALSDKPSSAFYAAGSPIKVHSGVKVEA